MKEHTTQGRSQVELLTVAAVAERLKVTTRTLRGWIAAKRLPVVRLSRRAIRIRRSDLERFLEGCEARK